MRPIPTLHWADAAALAAIAGATAAAVGMAACGPHTRASAERYLAAMQAYEAGRWPQAYVALAALADDGDGPSARVATMMAHEGPVLFGQHFDVSPQQLARWDRAMRGQSPAAALAQKLALVQGDDAAPAPDER